MSRQGFTELPNSHVNSTRLPYLGPQILWGHNRIPPHHLVSTFRPGSLVIDLVPQLENDKKTVKQEHEQRQATLEPDLDQAILAQTGSLAGLSESQAIERRITVVKQLQAQLGPRLEAARQQANRFFGTDPEHRTFREFLTAARAQGAQADPRQAWLESYRAAFEIKYLEQQHSQLVRRQHILRSNLSSARARERSNSSIALSLDRVEQAIVRTLSANHELQVANSTLQTMLTAFERHRDEDIAEAAALEHSRELERETSDLLKARAHQRASGTQKRVQYRRLATEMSRLDFDLKLHGPRATEAHRAQAAALQAQASAHAAEHASTSATEEVVGNQLHLQANSAVEAAFDEQALLSTLTGRTPSNTPVTFNAWVASTQHPLVVTTSRGGTAHFEPIWDALGTAIGNAALRLLSGTARHLTLLLYAARLGDGERMGVTVPLALMTPSADLTQEANRKVGQTLELPLRMNAVPEGTQTEVYLAATDGSSILRDVRVRQAQWDTTQGAYRFTAEGPGGATLLWHPATPPSTLGTFNPENDSFTPGVPIVEDLPKHLPGNIIVPPQPDIRTFPELPDLQIDDYVIIFPADSGLAPIYVMLRSPRYLPGVASGSGAVTPDRVLDAASTAAGAPIPARIAERLRGRRFSRFDKLREAVWKEIVADEVFRVHLSRVDIQSMENGTAPYSRKEDRVGKRMKLEIHHKHEIAEGGAVYDLDNLVLMTPKVHINEHRGSKP
ncbi:S-type pyocin domain-containing protein [Pseudomonas juntendi]|uniref:S-type pyocin domain-containing protein n=1 Tax=Pseudomonas juntendi TaxID=2666183 RepID=A0A7W2KKG2_9PSED|nr:S-type pyocin domain-containing protein [Pseudomonas juntendi]MBA6100193.1 S-type pyocin domain-containing protein [Pseudomonas juntendi]